MFLSKAEAEAQLITYMQSQALARSIHIHDLELYRTMLMTEAAAWLRHMIDGGRIFGYKDLSIEFGPDIKAPGLVAKVSVNIDSVETSEHRDEDDASFYRASLGWYT